MATPIIPASQRAAFSVTPSLPQLRATLAQLSSWVTSATQASFAGSAVESMLVTPAFATWRLVIAFNQNVSRVLVTPRAPLVDPVEYLDAVTSRGIAFYLRRVAGAYKINGTDALTPASFNVAISRAIAR